MSIVNERPTESAKFKGFYRNVSGEPDHFLAAVERGTPGGDFHRRFWQPVAYERELGKVPLRVRALGEDLVVFKTLKGEAGCLHLQCCHRNSSLEFGILTQDGIRCCYHGREYSTDGACIAVPGDPNAERIMGQVNQGGYPVEILSGIVFVYMGLPEKMPVLPHLDRLGVPGVRDDCGMRFNIECNWLQVKENAMDPHHTAVLHMIPHMRAFEGEKFANEFGVMPELTWFETPIGCIYLGVRTVGDMVWVRSAEIAYPNLHMISSVTESGREAKYSSAPFMSLWTLPVDSEHSVQFYIRHNTDAGVSVEQQTLMEAFGQYHNDRPYEERQWIAGDVDAQESQGAINVHAAEQLGTLDRGVTLFRKMVRLGIEAVARGEDPPHGYYLTQADVPPTYTNDFVVAASETGIDTSDPAALRAFAHEVWKKYQQRSPMEDYREKAR
jgi:phenylpropionate dioxygenase-like ring-hydroxylating dioxygenase large terminal subunit